MIEVGQVREWILGSGINANTNHHLGPFKITAISNDRVYYTYINFLIERTDLYRPASELEAESGICKSYIINQEVKDLLF